MNIDFNRFFGFVWILSPVILIYLKYFKNSFYRTHGYIINILIILSILLIPWLIFMFFILSSKIESNDKSKLKIKV